MLYTFTPSTNFLKQIGFDMPIRIGDIYIHPQLLKEYRCLLLMIVDFSLTMVKGLSISTIVCSSQLNLKSIVYDESKKIYNAIDKNDNNYNIDLNLWEVA